MPDAALFFLHVKDGGPETGPAVLFELERRNLINPSGERSTNLPFSRSLSRIHEDGAFFEHGDETDWPSYEEDLREVSRLFPGALFELYVNEGAESDSYYAYFVDGKHHEGLATTTHEPFDPARLR